MAITRNGNRSELIAIAGRNGDRSYVELLEGRSPAISPDGSKIAFSRVSNNNRDIYVADADGSDTQQLTMAPTDDDQPTWVSENEVVWVSKETGVPSLFRTHLKTNEHKLLSGDGFWSDPVGQSGRVIAVQRVSATSRIAVVDLASGSVTRITGSNDGRSPIWRSANSVSYIRAGSSQGVELVTLDLSTKITDTLELPAGTSVLVRPSAS